MEGNNEKWQITREADDPLALRLSVGSHEGKFGYIVYRGETKECLQLLYRAYQEMDKFYKEQGE
jgi:hypothetical protein